MRNVTVTITLPETSGTGEQHATVIKQLIAPFGYEDAIVTAGGIPPKQAVEGWVNVGPTENGCEVNPERKKSYEDWFGDNPDTARLPYELRPETVSNRDLRQA